MHQITQTYFDFMYTQKENEKEKSCIELHILTGSLTVPTDSQCNRTL